MANDKQFVIVVYDISNDKRRTKLHKKLKDYGSPVQYSVFECVLDSDEIRRMKQEIRRIIRPRLDHVRYYTVCSACRKKIEVSGSREITAEPEVIIV